LGRRVFSRIRFIEQSSLPGGLAPADREGAVHQVVGELPLLFHLFHDARAQHLEQARHDDHDRRADFLDVRCELLKALGIIDLRAHADRQVLAASMLIGVAERQER
jgi:hypothetical protein